MSTWHKLMGSAQFLMPNLVVAFVQCCSNHPHADSITPNYGSQGTTFDVAITGSHFLDCYMDTEASLLIDGNGYYQCTDFCWDYLEGWNDAYLPATLHIGSGVWRGNHTIAVQTDGGVSSLNFTVTCPGCPPPPQLFTVVSQHAAKLMPGGTVTFIFEGANLLNNNLQVQIDGFDVHAAPGPYNVQNNGYFDYFSADITADRTAAGSVHQVYLTTDGGNSNPGYITVDASQTPPSPAPGGKPSLNKIIPMPPTHITRFASQFTQVSVKFEGTGFGARHEILVDQNSTISGFTILNEYQSDPDQVMVGLPNMNLPTGSDSSVTLRILNDDNGTMSDPYVLFLDDPVPLAPVVTEALFVGGPIHQNSLADLYIEGQNLQGVTEQGFSGVPGLTFSSLFYWNDGALQVHVQADATAPLSADEATNLVITTAHGQSNLFWVQILPPL